MRRYSPVPGFRFHYADPALITLIVPGLIWTRQALADLSHDLPLPAFTALLGRGALLSLIHI